MEFNLSIGPQVGTTYAKKKTFTTQLNEIHQLVQKTHIKQYSKMKVVQLESMEKGS